MKNTSDNKIVDNNRRKFSKAGVAAPIIMTLASRPVFGVPCLSNMMSGNLSDPDRGGCVLGYKPKIWRKESSATEWTNLGLEYGDISDTCSLVNPDRWQCFTGHDPATGKVDTSTLAMLPSLATVPGYDPNYSLLGCLWTAYGGDLKHGVCATLNAMAIPDYALTVAEVAGLLDGSVPPVPGLSGRQTIKATYG